MSETKAIIEALRNLSCELRDLDVGYSVPRVPFLTSIEFLREYVSCNKPVIFTNAITHWPALTKWTKEYLLQQAGNDPVTVALTPNGRADCPTKFPSSAITTAATATTEEEHICFALPYERKTSLATFFKLLETSHVDMYAPAPYMQFQNSSLTKELPNLISDVSPDLPFATEAFSCLPEAVNLWIGGKRTITSWHKDNYENLYAMVSGTKSFRLLPPTDSYRMKQKRFPLARWHLIPLEQKNSNNNISSSNAINSMSMNTQLDDKSIENARLDDSCDIVLTEQELQNGNLELKFVNPTTAAAVAAGNTSLDEIGTVGEDYIIWSGIFPTPLSSSSLPASKDDDGGASGTLQKEINSKIDINLYDDPTLPAPLIATLHPGEVLYIPACWWHEVHHGDIVQENSISNGGDGDGNLVSEKDSGVAIAVNYWYDQKFDVKYVAMKAVEELARAAGLCEGEVSQ